MKRRILSLILVLALALSLSPWALAAESRETDFFEDQPHTELSFDEIEYKHIEAEPILAAFEEIRSLMEDAANEETVSSKFDAVVNQIMEILTMSSIANILVTQDVTNETYKVEYAYVDMLWWDVFDVFALLCRDLLTSPCAAFLKAQLTDDDIAYYSAYEKATEEDKARNARETELVLAYYDAALQSYAVEYEGETYEEAAVEEAYAAGEMEYEFYDDLLKEFAKAKNAVMGEIFMEMLSLRQKTAKKAGYKNYGDYTYEVNFDRDYTIEELQPFQQAVKDYLLYTDTVLSAVSSYEMDDPVFVQDYTGKETLTMVEGYLKQMSTELAEPFTYMIDHEMYDLTYSETKQGGAFTTILPSYGAPYMISQPYPDLSSFTTLIHEFGHYNNFYWTPAGWNEAINNIDTSEVHSQGMEMLFSGNYPQIFGDSANAVLDYQIASMVRYGIMYGCLFGELEQYIYTTPNVTLEQINRKYLELQKDYGMTTKDDDREMAYGWVNIQHLFEAPGYYISYAVSAAGALAFWLDAQESDYYEAVDKYLEFVALPAETGFQESFEKLGMENPLDPAFIESLAAELLAATDAEERLPGLMLSYAFTDISGSPWYTEPVLSLVMAGLIDGYTDGSFRPNDAASWGQALKLVLEMVGSGQVPPVEGGTWASGYEALALELGVIDAQIQLNGAITRAEFAAMLCKAFEIPASESESPFVDEADGYAVVLAEAGVLDGIQTDGGMTFQGEGTLTRAQLCKILYKVLEIVAAEETPAA